MSAPDRSMVFANSYQAMRPNWLDHTKISKKFTQIPLLWCINEWGNDDKFQYFSQNFINIFTTEI